MTDLRNQEFTRGRLSLITLSPRPTGVHMSVPQLTFGPNTPSGVQVDLDRLLQTKLAILANSRGGKSWLMRSLLEGLHGHVQQLVVDVEGEYATLREVYDDYVILAKSGGDLDVDEATVGPVMVALLQADANVILDLYEFLPERRDKGTGKLLLSERDAVTAAAIEALMALPKGAWRHLLVAVDEAQTLAPEGRVTPAASALTDLVMRGAKRGYGAVFASQRLALLSNSLTSQCSNRIIGFHSLGNDVKRAGDELGFTKREADALRDLEPGHFYAFGPAISRRVVRVKSGPVKSTHPEPGGVVQPTPPTSASLGEVIASLRTVPPAHPDEGGLAEAERARYEREIARLREQIEGLEAQLATSREATTAPRVDAAPHKAQEPAPPRPADQSAEKVHRTPPMPKVAPLGTRSQPLQPTQPLPANPLPLPQQRILNALAELEVLGVTNLDRTTLAVLSDQSPKSSAYRGHLATLQREGYTHHPGGGAVALTDMGRSLADTSAPPATVEALHRRWYAYLAPYERRLLAELIEVYPAPLSRDALAKRAGRSANSSAYRGALAHLKALGLTTHPGSGQVKANTLVFPSWAAREHAASV